MSGDLLYIVMFQSKIKSCYLCLRRGKRGIECRLISTLSQSYCVSSKAEMDPREPTRTLVSTLLQLRDCSAPLRFDWRRNDLPLNQTVLINLLPTTNIPDFTPLHFLCTPAPIHTLILIFKQAAEPCTHSMKGLIWEEQLSGFWRRFF